ncbi:MAG: hypothetical protein AB1599_01170 [Planctomycetota bacterium]
MRNREKSTIRERCREHMPCGTGCPGYVPQVKQGALTTQRQLEAFTCSLMHLCRKCYRQKFPIRKMWNLPENRHGSEKVLTPAERKHIQRSQFEYMEIYLWEPEFYYEWLDALYDDNHRLHGLRR